MRYLAPIEHTPKMNKEQIIEFLQLVSKNLEGRPVNRANNSIGSHIFIKFGKEIESVNSSGRKRMAKEWCIWISRSCWRLSKNASYVVGSNDDRKLIIPSIQNLLGRKFKYFEINSKYFEISYYFEGGYQLTTFFNKLHEDQWIIFLPDGKIIHIDCSDIEKIKEIQIISNEYTINEVYQRLDLHLDKKIIDVIYYKYNLAKIICEGDFSIEFDTFSWRLEKNDEYYAGSFDEVDDENNFDLKNKISEIIGHKIQKIDINNMMDARFNIGDQYVLKIFISSKIADPWEIFLKDERIFCAEITPFNPNIETFRFPS